MKICKRCKTELIDVANYCIACGNNHFENISMDSLETSMNYNKLELVNENFLPPPPSPLNDFNYESYQKTQKQNIKKRTKLCIGVIFISIILIFSSFYIFVIKKDTDGDGHPDRKDVFPNNKNEWKDSDHDGVGDNSDAFLNDISASKDTDLDGYPDSWNKNKNLKDSTMGLKLDSFPVEPLEWNDSDLDGYGDNSDVFPLEPKEWIDTDNDDFGDNCDAFPNDPKEWKDTDGDGYGDNSDDFPSNPFDRIDSDGDMIGDNADIYDKGNGAIKISITSYKGDTGSDESDEYDPYFIINLDTNSDSNYDISDRSKTYDNYESIKNPHSYTYDAPENLTSIMFNIEIWDEDFWSMDDIIDYTPDSNDNTEFTIYPPFDDNWHLNGVHDEKKDEEDCVIRFQIKVISI